MKREDAIWILELISNRDARTDAEKDAVNAAIEALKAQLSSEGTTSDTISRQAAIDELRKFKPEIIPYDKARIYVEKTVETMYDRIVELPTIQPVATDTNVGDKISRQAAIDELPYLLDYDGLKGENGFVSKRLVRKMLKELPSAQPEPQEGHWIRTDCGLDVECKCSRCGYKDFVSPYDTYWFNRNFCPNCGANMRGERL